MPDIERKKRIAPTQTLDSRPGVDDPTALDLYSNYSSGQIDPTTGQLTTSGQAGGGTYTGVPGQQATTADPYTTPTGISSDYVGNQFLDNPAAAVNNIMQGLGLSVSSNSPFYNTMSQLAPGLEWLQYFTSGTGSPSTFLGNVGNWFNQGTQGSGSSFGGLGNLSNIFNNFLSGGNTADLSAMIDNMTPEDITRALGAMLETGLYGSAGSRVRQGLQARLADAYSQFIGQQPTIEAGLGAGQTIADAFLNYFRQQNLLSQLGF